MVDERGAQDVEGRLDERVLRGTALIRVKAVNLHEGLGRNYTADQACEERFTNNVRHVRVERR